MKIGLIGCWFKDDIYSHSCFNLIESLKHTCNADIDLITSNCGCFSSAQTFSCSEEELIDTNCSIVKIPYAPPEPSKKYGLFKYYLVKLGRLNFSLEVLRGISFFRRTRQYDLIHFDQVLKSFGFLSFLTFLLLAKTTGKKVVVTVHELDPFQEKHRGLNGYYNKADRIIVHATALKDGLSKLGVKEKKIEVVPYGVSLSPINDLPRNHFIFFGGHKLLKGKGFDTLLSALKILQSEGEKVKLVIYTGEGCVGLEEGKKMVHDMELDPFIIWSDFLYGAKLTEAYQRSIACLIPYTGGSARYPATHAMANATPVIGTTKADLPEYVGDLRVCINEDSPKELAGAMTTLMKNPDIVRSLGKQMRMKAEMEFSWDVIAGKTFQIYSRLKVG